MASATTGILPLDFMPCTIAVSREMSDDPIFLGHICTQASHPQHCLGL